MLIACLIFFPMLAAPIVWMIGRKRNEAVEIAASVVTAVELLLAVLLWKYHDPLDLAAVLPGGLHFRADGFRLVYCLLAYADKSAKFSLRVTVFFTQTAYIF